MANWIELYTPGDSALVVLARSYRDQAAGAAAATAADAIATAADRAQTAQDRIATGQDRTQAGLDRAATSADRVQTGLDRAATAADRVQTGLDRASATGSAGTATTQAGIATAQAGIATAQATAALGSAAAAAASVPAAADRTVGRRLHDIATWAVVRSTPAWGFGVTGALEETPVDTVRFEFDPVTLAPLGVPFAGARTNLVTNARFQGAVAPATNPSGMTLAQGPTNGVSITIGGTGTVSGMPFIDIVVSGTATASGTFVCPFRSNAAAGNSVAHAVQWRIQSVAGTPLIGVQPNLRTNLGGVGAVGTSAPAPLTMAAIGAVLTTPASGITSASMALRLNYANGVTYNETIRIANPQFRQAPFMDAPILPPVGTPSDATRAQGIVDTPVREIGTDWNPRQGIVVVDWTSASGPFIGSVDEEIFGILSLGDLSADNVMGVLVNRGHGVLIFRRTVGGVAQPQSNVTVPIIAANTLTRAAFAWDIDTGQMQVAASGLQGSLLTGQTVIPPVTHVMRGRFGPTRPLFGTLAGIEIRPAALFGAPLAALT